MCLVKKWQKEFRGSLLRSVNFYTALHWALLYRVIKSCKVVFLCRLLYLGFFFLLCFFILHSVAEGPFITGENVDTSSDLMLAQMLQMEFDREYDAQLRREEKKFNGDSKGIFALETFEAFYLHCQSCGGVANA